MVWLTVLGLPRRVDPALSASGAQPRAGRALPLRQDASLRRQYYPRSARASRRRCPPVRLLALVLTLPYLIFTALVGLIYHRSTTCAGLARAANASDVLTFCASRRPFNTLP